MVLRKLFNSMRSITYNTFTEISLKVAFCMPYEIISKMKSKKKNSNSGKKYLTMKCQHSIATFLRENVI